MRLGRDLCVAVMVLGLALVACKKDKSESKGSDTTSGDKSGSSDKPAEGTAASGDAVGVPACDEYLTKYEKCISSKVPEAQRAAMKQGMQQMRDGWKQAAATPAGKAGLEAGCKQALETAKTSMTAFGCEW